MWYVVQVFTGTEEKTRLQCQNSISSDVIEDCFIPYYEEKKHIRGEWVIQKKILFPGYLFFITTEIEKLYRELQYIQGLTKLLKTGEDVVSLTEEEVNFLISFGGKEQIVPLSEGIIVNSKVKVLSGPLVGREGYIRKIDRHKRKALLEIAMFGRMLKVQMGLEIVEKT